MLITDAKYNSLLRAIQNEMTEARNETMSVIQGLQQHVEGLLDKSDNCSCEELEARLSELEEDVGVVETNIDTIEDDVNALDTRLTTDINALDTRVTADINDIETQLNEVVNDINNLEDSNAAQDKTIDDITVINTLQDEMITVNADNIEDHET